MATPAGACLIVADISGYTRYLAGVELDHAQDILADLLGTVVGVLRPTFTFSKLEGDAVFVYRIDETVDGSVLLDTVEGAYFAFKKRLISIRQASVCECQACLMIGELNLKVVVHFGQVVEQVMMGQTELVGADVIVVHRMLKNGIDTSAYAFITDQCIAASGLKPEALGMYRHSESYEHIGEVSGWVIDLERAWAKLQERTTVRIEEEDASVVYSAFYPAPVQLVWEHISVPALRLLWNFGLDRVDEVDESGRRRRGTLNHCMHGKDVILQEFLDWRPPRYLTARATLPNGMSIVTTQEVEPVEGGSILHERFGHPVDDETAGFFESMRDFFDEAHRVEVETLTGLLAEAVASREAEAEPELPQSDEATRHATSIRKGT